MWVAGFSSCCRTPPKLLIVNVYENFVLVTRFSKLRTHNSKRQGLAQTNPSINRDIKGASPWPVRRGGARRRGGSSQRNPWSSAGLAETFRHWNHPVCTAYEVSRHFLNGAATPPNLGGVSFVLKHFG